MKTKLVTAPPTVAQINNSDGALQFTVILQIFLRTLFCLSQLMESWKTMDESSRGKYLKKTAHCPDPCLAVYRPDICFGSVSETFESLIESYLSQFNIMQEFHSSSEYVDNERWEIFYKFQIAVWGNGKTFENKA